MVASLGATVVLKPLPPGLRDTISATRVVVLTSLVAALSACPRGHRISVLYANRTNGTAVITWLSPGTARPHWIPTPGHPIAMYEPGFRTDTVHPGEHKCKSFFAPSDSVAPEFTVTGPHGMELSGPGRPIKWRTESSWGFDGVSFSPAGDSLPFGRRVMRGC